MVNIQGPGEVSFRRKLGLRDIPAKSKNCSCVSFRQQWTRMFAMSRSAILTWERRPIGHEDQLVSDGFGSGVVVHMLFKDKENRATRWGQGHFGSHCLDLLAPGMHFCF